MSTNKLRCNVCRSWLIPINYRLLCPKCDSGEICRIGKDYERKFVEKMDKEGKNI